MNVHLQNLIGFNNTLMLSPAEIAILALLQTHAYLAEPVIDIVSLQNECMCKDISSADFYQGFLRLLARRLIEPHGEMRYTLSADGHRHLKIDSLKEYCTETSRSLEKKAV